MTTNTITPPAPNPIIAALQNLLRSKDIVMALSLVILVGMLLLPLPAFIIDLAVALSIAVSIGIVLLTMFIKQPMEFSVFPTVLLLVTLFRLGINVSVSRLILLSGEAGQIITTFGNLIVGGNYVVGVVIFLILMIIQFVVINSGAGRVAEVAARFTLDAMPGKQMAIDADLNAGLIDENQARQRRKMIEAEADFYGAMDGASKFVKGDAIAAIIIMLVNIIGGFVIGAVQRGMDLTTALQTYVLLTIGAGLAIQVPSLLVSAAAGLIVTRSTSESSLGTEVSAQVSNFNVLAVGALVVGLMTLVPGLPTLPFVLVSVGLGVAAYFVNREQAKAVAVAEAATLLPARPTEPETPEQMLEMVVVDPIELEIGYSLIPIIDEDNQDNLLRRITSIRRQLMSEMGFILPVVRIRDNLRLSPQSYRIKIRGQEVAASEIMLDRLMAIPGSDIEDPLQGIPTSEPAFGLPAIWISSAEQNQAEARGYTVVTPLSVICTHLTEVVRGNAAELLSRQLVQEMLNQLRQKAPASVEGVTPELLNLGEIQSVLRNLLRERVPIRDLSGILEVLANNAPMTRDPHILAEAVRQSMAHTISSQYKDEANTLHVFTLAPQLETALRASLVNSEGSPGFGIDAGMAQKVLLKTGEQMEALAQLGHFPILICPRELRLAFRRLVDQSLPNLIVMAFSEVGHGTRVKAHGMVKLD
ncbi:MAG TPA: flagellar biosynthesis protein FlhA [Anaerolineales bacterium]|nr:flagellar biosynthesis protein FlhA [Anaerolineales bacterium]HNA87830.1 flagellar biosynthesis protein FlhA [Anaerolineales bacterium]HNC88378.1 flagellar biosynthesis protein FlhA [Anaerolineales bacterium]HND91534.1 flagellar biosynthesis protein FlhA [Anaerolineales bacterium]HNF34798.1 flagellar biosynthesis protein FlhA [Anaerolineales bacterium]